jgi:hypothetical protein
MVCLSRVNMTFRIIGRARNQKQRSNPKIGKWIALFASLRDRGRVVATLLYAFFILNLIDACADKNLKYIKLATPLRGIAESINQPTLLLVSWRLSYINVRVE